MDNFEHLERLIIDFKESLEREMHTMREEMNRGFADLGARLDNQATRLERHAALLQSGSRWTNRMNHWADKVDAALEEKDRQISALSERVRRLEQDRNGEPGEGA